MYPSILFVKWFQNVDTACKLIISDRNVSSSSFSVFDCNVQYIEVLTISTDKKMLVVRCFGEMGFASINCICPHEGYHWTVSKRGAGCISFKVSIQQEIDL